MRERRGAHLEMDFTSTLAMRQWLSEVTKRTGQQPKVIFASQEEIDTYYNTCITDKRQINTLLADLPNGLEAKGLDFCGIPVVEDKPEYKLSSKQLLRILQKAQ